MEELVPGLTANIKLTVTDGDTAIALRSGDVPVLATPRLIALAEEATVAAVRDHLAHDATTVGSSVQLDHVAPTPTGGYVVAEAVLARVSGRRLVFKVTVNDDRGLVAAGKITRVVVERQRFIQHATAPSESA